MSAVTTAVRELSQEDKLKLAAYLMQQGGEAAGRPQLDLLSWTALHRRELKPGRPFDLTEHAYMRDIYAGEHQKMIIFKASQMGASEYAISYTLHLCDQHRATVLYVFPTSTHISDFSSARINPALDASSYLNTIVSSGSPGPQARESRRGTDRVLLKQVGDGYLYLRGGVVSADGSAPQLKSVDADAFILDEVDEMDMRTIPLAKKRLGHSKLAQERYISTPTYQDTGIHALYQNSDMRQWFVRCSHCGTRQVMAMRHVITEWDQFERPSDWHGKDEDRAYAACEKCGRELNRLGPGEWVAEYPSRDVTGFHLTRLFSPHANVIDMVESLITVDESYRKEAVNQDWGLPYKPRGGQLTDHDLMQCEADYRMGIVEGERVFMGVDVGSRIHVVLRRGANNQGKRALRLVLTVESLDEVGRLIRAYNVRRCVIDALPETSAARSLQRDLPAGKVFLCYFNENRDPSPFQFDPKRGILSMDRTRGLDALMAQFYLRENLLPADIDARAPEYKGHLKSLVRVIDRGRGRGSYSDTAKYVSSGDDHYAFAELYCLAASQPIVTLAPGIVATRQTKGWN